MTHREPEPDPFTGYTTARTFWYAVKALTVLAIMFFAVVHFTGPR